MWPFDIFDRTKKYILKKEIVYLSPRYGKTITGPKGFASDGATAAPDLSEKAFFVHDWLCTIGKWDDGTEITNWQASTVYSDILGEEGFWFRRHHRRIATYLFGGGKLKDQDEIRNKDKPDVDYGRWW